MSCPIPIPIRSKKLRRKSKTVKSLDVVNCDEHPLDQSFDSDYDSIFDESFESSSISSNSSFTTNYSTNNSTNNSSINLTKNSPININKKSKSLINLNQINIEFSKFSIRVDETLTSNLSILKSKSKLTGTTNTSTGVTRSSQITHTSITKNNYLLPDYDFLDIELTTFKRGQCEAFERLPTKTFKNRDERINCRFLHLYAMDYHCRVNRYLPHSNKDTIPESQQQIHNKHNLFKLSNDSKDKLWNSIVLKPRDDQCPSYHIDHHNYIYNEDQPMKNCSLVMRNGQHLPWSTHSKSLKPTGIIPNKGLINGLNPNSGVTNCQYTIKGWCNKRWSQ